MIFSKSNNSGFEKRGSGIISPSISIVVIGDGVIVGVGGTGVIVAPGIDVSVETIVATGAHETKTRETSKTVTKLFNFIDYLIMQGVAQRLSKNTH